MEHISSGISHALAGKKKSSSKLHSEAHLLADEITRAWNEPKQFALYLGIIKRIGIARARSIFSDINQQAGLATTSRVKLFMWNARKDNSSL
ncbi:MAG: hypothetical protein A3H59_02680 [Candidatus Jacksonbacteria bacterium RIFCSPLOWO2_02_FULL_43_9]|nr:MAG: hypothetical protein UV70_C0011G0027 [Parcubacteria group bacterium GW2011_GWA2_43_13]OGY69323.1 MAG: hypothetical protein A3B94_03050 [Candidatus Jacksonbacteria bacterium RIFCSPHIGHO2_02_FULL_43_10]OGY71220.1 MAG: hypothetical protein A2986_00130 [Candidatus Jacksonbacteria bacterium RIFCSPLOWO2_01_FULL_44_13]OGY71919.1 MAG: hypothetical protein A3H59_02680 [Candidatus Jacksonbacteria bacterium RIFCSPLOWO2_02_FULL_43_9]HAZ16801.1 hypothetical protein [Candidatus Jacksonbacteria bacter